MNNTRIKLFHGHEYRFQPRHTVVVLRGTFWFDESGMRFEVPDGEFRGMKNYAVYRPSECERIWEVEDGGS